MAQGRLAAEDAAQLLLELAGAVRACRAEDTDADALARAVRRATAIWRDALPPGLELDVRVLAGRLVTPEGVPVSGPGIDELAAELDRCNVEQLCIEGGLEPREILLLVSVLAGDLGPIESPEQFQERMRRGGSRRVHVAGVTLHEPLKLPPSLETDFSGEGAAREMEAQLGQLEKAPDLSTYNLICNRIEVCVDTLLRERRQPDAYRAVVAYWRQVMQGDTLPVRLHHEACDRLRRLLAHDALMEHVVAQATGSGGRASVQASQVLLCSAPQSLPVLLRHLANDPPETAQRIGAILIAMGERALPALLEELDHVDPMRARRAARLLGDIQHPNAVERLAAKLELGDVGLRTEAVKSLARIGSAGAMAALVQALGGPADLARLAAGCLGQIRQRAAVGALSEVALGRTGAAEEVVEEAVRSLGRIGDPSAVSALVEVLQHKPLLSGRRHRSRRIAAAQALGRLGGREAYRALEAHSQGGDREVREACQRAIRALAEGRGARSGS